MSDEHLARFHQRLDRIAQERDPAAMPAATQARRPRRDAAARRRPARRVGGLLALGVNALLYALILGLVLKAGLMSGLGPSAYAARHAQIAAAASEGTARARLAGLMAPDPLSLRLYQGLRRAGLPDAWARRPPAGRSAQGVDVGPGQPDVVELFVAEP